jgi:hypothetical protein
MTPDKLVYQTTPKVIIATNTFINVPIILKYEDINLIEVIKETNLGYTTQIPIYHSDGTYLAKVTGMRIYPTKEGEKAGLTTEKYKGLWVCKMNNKTVFEVHQHTGEAFKTIGELFTPDGYFIKFSNDLTLHQINEGSAFQIGGVTMSGNTIVGCKIGIWLRKNGFLAMGTNG